ncbi:MAG: type I polyketide synthase [Thiohalocapsa sp. PB-PSB1]|mgnify:CR=1 FL=1|jgi:amino acid adenylation domain-containing protein|nr:MAG: hypothetical protein N838_01690 [Thiohalocapsa sp. PB-PSB1]QQO55896.1 MAG: type I polyketide synthase [Thiohalocapsa sp. PB-PSB1]HCS92682.1 type I polyketide synthase [Chromatiaceae bacterium]
MTKDADSHLLAAFLEHAKRTPDALALVTPDGNLSYAELRAHCQRIAGGLIELGVDPGHDQAALVGLCMPRGADAVAAMLGILLAGGAYIPVDPAYPSALRQRMIREAGLRLLLTDSRQSAEALACCCDQVLTLADLERQAQAFTQWPPVPAADRLFHVLYTSGSTATPKGVCGTHGQMRARLAWLWQDFPLADDELVCHKTALHFVDASLEVFGTLLCGRPLLIAPDSHTANPAHFIDLLAMHGATRIALVVSQLRTLLLAAPDLGHRLPRLRLCIVSGERLTADLVETYRRALPDTALINLYGCSEVPEVSWAAITADTLFDDTGAPIGQALPGTELYIVDEDLRIVAPGEIGELLVGGPLLASGYLGRNAEIPGHLTDRFIANPFGVGGRLHRTGDRVRLDADGLLRFAGREDDQVKIRGHRIALSAVESAVLDGDDRIEAAAAVVQQDPNLAENRSLVVFVIPRSIDATALLAKLRAQAPRHLLPQRIIALDRLPTTASGKLDRRQLASLASLDMQAAVSPDEDLRVRVAQLWREVLLRDAVGRQDGFFDVGGDSLALAQLHRRLQMAFPHYDLTLAELLEYPTIGSQAAYLERTPTAAVSIRPRSSEGRDMAAEIAVIGMACRFPGASTPEDFWHNLCHGVDSISDFPDQELEQPDPALRNAPDYVKAGAVLEDIASFDAELFGYTDKEAALLDPQQRLLLECALEAMERAGVVPGGCVGVYAGSSQSGYFVNQVATTRPVTEATLREYQANLANDRNFLATRIAYKLSLSGPAVTVQTACSTGLVVVHMACQALRTGECDAALAGAVALRVPQKAGYLYEEGMIRSADGRCRAFDADAQGTLFGSGVGIVLLKPLARAQADGDPILAVIKGSAINNDAADKVGYTAPSVAGQSAVIATALHNARVDPHSIGYVEAHGTGTRLGDPIEIAALTRAFVQQGWQQQPEPAMRCAIGSVKTNLGHLDEAAGIAGFIKTVLALMHRQIPPSLHYHKPNPEIDFDRGPFEVNTQLRPWPTPPRMPRRAGVSSFGMGGTNCHLVLEQAPAGRTPAAPPAALTTNPSHQLLVLSAASGPGLHALAAGYRDLLDATPQIDLASLCASAAVGRRHLGQRCALIASSVAELRERLAALSIPRVKISNDDSAPAKIAFLFTGQGAQYANMARGLYDSCAPFRAAIDRCAEVLEPLLPRPLTEVMFCAADATAQADEELAQTRYTQPALFALEYALAALWRSFGIQPDLVMGHSVGEYVAACVAGAIPLEDALRIVAERGRLIQALPAGGGMLSVELDEAQAHALLAAHAEQIDDSAVIAAINGPARTLISGSSTALDMLAERLAEQCIDHRYLKVSHAFHSPLMEPMLGPFAEIVGRARWTEPKIPLISNVTGTQVAAELTDSDYWIRHTRSAVRFADGIRSLLDAGAGTLIEIGPSPTLLGMIPEIAAAADMKPLRLPSLRRNKDDWAQLLDSLGQLYTAGAEIDWHGLYDGQHWQRLLLPTTVFQHKRYWLDPADGAVSSADLGTSEQALHDRLLLAVRHLQQRGELPTGDADRLVGLLMTALHEQASGGQQAASWQGLVYTPIWRSLPAASETGPWVSWLILADRAGIGAALANRIEDVGQDVILHDAGRQDPDSDQLRPLLQSSADSAQGSSPLRVICLWGLDAMVAEDASGTALLDALETVYPRIQALLDAMTSPYGEGTRAWLVTRGAQPTYNTTTQSSADGPSARFNPVQATLWGLWRSFALEQPPGFGGLIDLSQQQDVETCAEALWQELRGTAVGEQVLLHGEARQVARLVPKCEQAIEQPLAPASIHADAAYLITGGLGALGFEIAETLADLGARHLVLASRGGVRTQDQHKRLERLRGRGVATSTPMLDVADETALAELFARFRWPGAGDDQEPDLPPLRGIVHAAGTIAAEPSARPDWTRIASILRAKVAGGWALHRHSRGLPLDLFVLFSSASSLLGLAGHADYASANAFLDALAGERLRLGLPALSINWGDWAGTGMAAAGPADAQEQTGLGALAVTQARTALAALLGERGQVAVLQADWQCFRSGFQAHQALLADCIDEATINAVAPASPVAATRDPRATLAAAGQDERQALLRMQLSRLVAEVLGHPDASILDADANLLSVGFDSLLLIELRNRLRGEFGVQIPLSRMLEGIAINAMAAEAAAQFDMAPSEDAAATTASTGDNAGEQTWTTVVI